MSIEAQNEAIVRRWVEQVWNERREATIDQYMHPQCDGHVEGGEFIGPDGMKQQWRVLMNAFPDFHVDIEQLIAKGDDVVFRWNARGTQKGTFVTLPPTGREVSFTGITWMKFEAGLMVEGWDRWNAGALLQNLASPLAAA